MPYQPFILKYRPRTFDDVVGQEHVSRTLRNALSSGRLVHAYLFTGPRGTGKTTMARILARALNCVNGPTPDPCGVCDQCRSIIEGRSMDIIEIDAASHRGIDDIRDLRESVKYAPSESRHKLYILDECHMLTNEANNALLKTLEEPPPHAYFALLTTEVYKLLPTILSRCQRFDFRPVSVPDTMQMLRRIAEAEGLEVQEEALAAIAHAAEGGMRDAESIFEQVVAFSEGGVTLEIANQVLGVTDADTLLQLAEIVARQDLAAVFPVVDRLVTEGKNLGRLIEDLTSFFRDLLRLALAGATGTAWLQLGPDGEARMRQAAQTIGQERLLTSVHALAELAVKLKESSQHALLLELALTELASSAPPAPKPAGRPAPAPQGAPPVQAPASSSQPPTVLPTPQAPTRVPPVQATTSRAPEPTPPPRPAPMPLDGPLSCAAIWSHWESVLEQLRVNVRAFLLDAVPTELEGDNLTLSFPAQCRFHAGQVKSHAEAIQGVLQGVFGRRFVLQTRVCDTDSVPPPAGSQSSAPPAGDAPAPGAPVAMPRPVAAPPAAAPAPVVTPPPTPAPQVAPPVAAMPTPAPPPGEEPAAQSRPPEETAAPGTTDDVVAQTLSLFPGSQEVLPPEQNHA